MTADELPDDDHFAFPWKGGQRGLTVRDYFAVRFAARLCVGAEAIMLANRDGRYDEMNWKEVVAANAYEFADAMLKMRTKEPVNDQGDLL